jgi:hypothetical protein|tara:strand:+ start:105 stop:272 length:168 start_codon:yes stop_codon:yes gene_type:complete
MEDLPIHKDYGLDNLVLQHILRIEIIIGGDNELTGMIAFRRLYHSNSELLEGLIV